MNRYLVKIRLLEKFNGISCPSCNKKDSLGFLGGAVCRKYFCGDCCVEFTMRNGTVILLSDLNTMIFEDEECCMR